MVRLRGETHGLEGLGSLESMFLVLGDYGSPHNLKARLMLHVCGRRLGQLLHGSYHGVNAFLQRKVQS